MEETLAKYKVGQECHYHTRPQEPNSTFGVVVLESSGKFGPMVHISVRGLPMKNPRVEGGTSETIAHLPFEEAAIAKSVTVLVEESVPSPDYQDGYQQWKEAYDAGQASIFGLSVAETVEAVESIMR